VTSEAARTEQRALTLPKLADDAHKGDAGRVLSVCGSRTMPGAAILVARAAQRAGAGLVTAACLDVELMQIIPAAAPEAILLELTRVSDLPFALASGGFHALVAGPGLGRSERTSALVGVLLASDSLAPLVLDADALNVLEGDAERMRQRRAPLVITPHPGEAARLLGREVPSDDAGRERFARELAKTSGAIVCLKGHHTVVTDGTHVFVNDTGNSGMATAGAGDVLTGILGAYLALCATGNHPEWTPLDAACAAVRAHGLAGDLAAAHLGKRALIASDLIAWLSGAQRRLEA
jgi:NAD(P)H-hydrate epimerase